MEIRAATTHDAAACAAIYAPYVRDTAVTFETDEPDVAEFARRIARSTERYAWFVAERDGAVVGYAYAGEMKTRAAYRFSVEVSVYLELGLRRAGVGRALYEALFARLAERGYRTVVAGMALPNPASEGLHRALGFEPVGVFRAVGWKLGGWHDVAWMQRALVPEEAGSPAGPPAEPR